MAGAEILFAWNDPKYSFRFANQFFFRPYRRDFAPVASNPRTDFRGFEWADD